MPFLQSLPRPPIQALIAMLTAGCAASSTAPSPDGGTLRDAGQYEDAGQPTADAGWDGGRDGGPDVVSILVTSQLVEEGGTLEGPCVVPPEGIECTGTVTDARAEPGERAAVRFEFTCPFECDGCDELLCRSQWAGRRNWSDPGRINFTATTAVCLRDGRGLPVCDWALAYFSVDRDAFDRHTGLDWP